MSTVHSGITSEERVCDTVLVSVTCSWQLLLAFPPCQRQQGGCRMRGNPPTTWNSINQNPLMLGPRFQSRCVPERTTGDIRLVFKYPGETTYTVATFFLRITRRHENYHETEMGLCCSWASTLKLLCRFSPWHRSSPANQKSVKPVVVSASIFPHVQSVQIAHATFLWRTCKSNNSA